MRELMTRHIAEQIGDDSDLLERVLPDYPPFGKRILQDNGWYRTLVRDDVELVTEPILEVTPDAVVTRDGTKHPVDVLLLATGYQAGKFLWPMEIKGRDGIDLHEHWGDDPRAYLGISIPRFPNLFCLYGPNTNPVVGSVVIMLECQVRYAMGCIREMIERGIDSLECREDVHDDYNRTCRRAAREDGLASSARPQLLQQCARPRRHERPLEADRLLEDDEGAGLA